MCAYAFFVDELNQFPIWWNSNIVRISCAIFAGYTLSDLILVLVNLRTLGGAAFIFHHFATIYAYYYVMCYGVFSYFANFRLLAEFSTPFVNFRWFFDTLGLKRSSPIVLSNAFTMTITFFLFRILAIPLFWYKVYIVFGTEEFLKTGYIRHVLFLTCAVLDVLNIYWFNLMCKGMFKALSNLNKSQNDQKAN